MVYASHPSSALCVRSLPMCYSALMLSRPQHVRRRLLMSQRAVLSSWPDRHLKMCDADRMLSETTSNYRTTVSLLLNVILSNRGESLSRNLDTYTCQGRHGCSTIPRGTVRQPDSQCQPLDSQKPILLVFVSMSLPWTRTYLAGAIIVQLSGHQSYQHAYDAGL